MEIGSIPGVCAVGLERWRPIETLGPVEKELEATARTGDDSYSGSRQTPERGLADEDEPSAGEDEVGPPLEEPLTSLGGKVNFIA